MGPELSVPTRRVRSVIVHQAHRLAFDPTQARALSAHCGAERFAFDWGASNQTGGSAPRRRPPPRGRRGRGPYRVPDAEQPPTRPGCRRVPAPTGVRNAPAGWSSGRGSSLVPASKTCSRCGVVKTGLPPHIRVFRRESCGVVVGRDPNAHATSERWW
uniref:zinc ribbon domain-containing protein n=1 Tax=Lentzea pudingi TaxID=1789439 RepID=UPI003570FC15